MVTGDLHGFPNRAALQEIIERRGGKVTGSVTKKTTCLINNDLSSTTGKNQKAKELGVPILDEDAFVARYLGSNPQETDVVKREEKEEAKA